ncbi:MAG: right-handed parallel beta-helix repeat-containing protein [Planctomycetes bacterium]|nr:right-handed parallel beta-helix repeat-containing protein [Planctomycetota bacterium]
MSPLRSCLAAAFVAAAALAQSATVSNLADAGPGSLRAALLAANASPAPAFTIDVGPGATAGPIVLATVLPSLSRSNVLVRATGGAGQLVVDARTATAAAGYGFEVAGNDVQVTLPCRFLVQQGNGVVVRGQRARFTDLEVLGALFGSGVVTVPGAHDLVLERLDARNFQQGLFLNDCQRARIADAGTGQAVVQGHSGIGIRVVAGGDHAFGSVACGDNELGLSAENSPNLVFGRPGAAPSTVALNRQQGVLLLQCAAPVLANLAVIANGIGPQGGCGIQVIGGAGAAIGGVQATANVLGGIAIQGGASNVRIGPNVATQGFGGPIDRGLTVFHATTVTIVDCSFGGNHTWGAALAPEGANGPQQVTFARCTFTGNRSGGVQVGRSTATLFASCTLAGNLGDGLEAVGQSLAAAPRDLRLADCTIAGNAGSGIQADRVDGLLVGAGCRLDDNLSSGVRAFRCAGLVVDGARSIDRNRNSGVWLYECDDAVVGRTTLHANRGAGIYAARCTGVAIGPAVLVADTVGSGLQWEECNGCRMSSSTLRANSAHGVHVFFSLGVPGTSPHVLQSCLIADHPGLAVFHAGGPPVVCELCTIAGNLRGVVSWANTMTVDSCIVRDNALEDLQQTATALTVRHTFHQVPPPAAGSTNSAADPLFVAPAARDWRLQAGSPAIGFANPALTVPPGAVDAFGGPRQVGALDAGAYEVGPHLPPTAGRLWLSGPSMPNGGGGLAFHVQYPTPAAIGTISLLLAEFGPPSGSFAVFGGVIPLGPTPALLAIAQFPDTIGFVGADGATAGVLPWGGTLPPSVQNQVVSLCGAAIDLSLAVQAVSDVASFVIQ